MLFLFSSIIEYVQELKNKNSSEIDCATVRERLELLLNAVVEESRLWDMDPRDVDSARFAIAAWLDEVVMGLLKLDAVKWSGNLLQKQFYDTTQAGERFFQYLDQNLDNISVLEVYYSCLTFGYKGMYAKEGDEVRLSEVTDMCKSRIHAIRGEASQYLELLKENYGRLGGNSHRKASISAKNIYWLSLVMLLISIYWGFRLSLDQIVANNLL